MSVEAVIAPEVQDMEYLANCPHQLAADELVDYSNLWIDLGGEG